MAEPNCPFLGMENDSETFHSYPSNHNYCNKATPLEVVSFKHQHSHCLTHKYVSCPVFFREATGPLPKHLVHRPRSAPSHAILRWAGVAIAALLILFLGVIWWGGLPINLAIYTGGDSDLTESLPDYFTPTSRWSTSPSQTPTAMNTAVIFTIDKGTNTPAPSPLPTETSTPTPTRIRPTPTPGPLLETPFGNQPNFLIHQVTEGESLVLIANRYGTSQEAIRVVNLFLPSPLWSGWLLVVPLNTVDVENIPAFEVYVTSEEDVNANQLAINLDTDLEALLYYNAISSAEDPLPPGRWLLIPRERSAQP